MKTHSRSPNTLAAMTRQVWLLPGHVALAVVMLITTQFINHHRDTPSIMVYKSPRHCRDALRHPTVMQKQQRCIQLWYIANDKGSQCSNCPKFDSKDTGREGQREAMEGGAGMLPSCHSSRPIACDLEHLSQDQKTAAAASTDMWSSMWQRCS